MYNVQWLERMQWAFLDINLAQTETQTYTIASAPTVIGSVFMQRFRYYFWHSVHACFFHRGGKISARHCVCTVLANIFCNLQLKGSIPKLVFVNNMRGRGEGVPYPLRQTVLFVEIKVNSYGVFAGDLRPLFSYWIDLTVLFVEIDNRFPTPRHLRTTGSLSPRRLEQGVVQHLRFGTLFEKSYLLTGSFKIFRNLHITDMFVIDHKEKLSLINHK